MTAPMSAPKCQFCTNELTVSLVDLGNTPLANSYLPKGVPVDGEKSYPLHARVCSHCRLVQVEAVTARENIFVDYAYFSSYSQSWVEHSRKFCDMARDRWNLSARSKVVEVASNDGYLLKHFVAASIPVLGVEPAANVAVEAINAGVPTEIAFFGTETAQRLKEQGHSADLLIGNNVFAHVPDINDFAGGLAILLKPDGVISLEFPHLLKLIQQTQFDTIYHEHYSYMSLLAAENIFRAQGLRIFDVEELPTHGGSLRIFACHEANSKIATGSGVESVRRDESAAQFDRDAGYAGFEPKVHAVRAQLREFLKNAKAQNKSVVGYGAAAKGNTLLNYCQIKAEDELIDYVVDLNPHKQDTLLPGSHIEVFSPSKIGETKPDYVLILPWNLRDEIIKQLDFVRQWGCEFVVAIPELTILP